ncbi:UNVERIFIED_CONTAM: protein NEDD1, partial [Sesamum radiatum]
MISFSNKGSRYLCSGGTGQVVRIWDLQNKRCVKWLKGHTDTITGVMYNCKDEHIASVSRKGDVILHNLASGTRAAELRDPNGQVLGALDYSRMSRHLLVTAGDDGSINLWDTTGRSPKVSWLKQHSAPTSGVSFSPSNDKIIASVGLDMKLYTFDTGSRKPSSCIPYEAPFSSLAFTDDGLTLAAAVTNLCWQRSKPVTVNENNCTDETVLLAGDAGDSILMPDPLPSRSSSSLALPTAASGSRNLSHSAVSGDMFSTSAGNSKSSAPSLSASEESPVRSSLLTGRTLGRLHAPRSYNFKDDMEVFSPLVEVQPITPTLDKLWDNHDGSKKDLDRKPSFLFSSRRFGSSEDGAIDNHPVSDWKPNSASKQ